MRFLQRRHLMSPLILFVFITSLSSVLARHRIRHHRDRFKRQQGANLYLPESYVTEGGTGQDAGAWTEWSTPSLCSRSCGGGVSTITRQCTPGYACQGPTTRHFSCNTQDCPDTGDFRAQQCSEFDSVPFNGVLYQWVPYTKAPNPCELYCMPRGEKFHHRHRNQVVDGTKCSDESFDVCVQGKCQPVGCDMMLGSSAREDRCRVCRGNGSTCNTVTGRFDMQDLEPGYNDILLIPAGATNILLQEVAPSDNYLAVRNTSGHYYLNGHWIISFPSTIEFAGCKFRYERQLHGILGLDTVSCLGPINQTLFVVMLIQRPNVGVDYEYSLPTNIQPGYETESYVWTFDQFSLCSQTCGGGVQYRNVSCVGRQTLEQAERSLCDANNEPAATQRCAEIPCDAQWVPYPWGNCSEPCGEGGVQTREIACQQIISNGYPSLVADEQCAKLHPKPPQKQVCNKGRICAKWHTGPWKPCNRLCGDGKETRRVLCYRNESAGIEIMNDSECEAIEPRPQVERKCNLRPCEGVDWITSRWSGCDKCGLTNETRNVQCATGTGVVYSDDLCDVEQKPEMVRQCKETKAACEYNWYASQWSECSAQCGQGVQTRTLFCGVITPDGTVKKVESDKCDSHKTYDTIRNCTGEVEKCPGEWFSGPWGECSKPCGGGERTKKVVCLKDLQVVDADECGPENIIFGREECNTHPCSEDTIIPTDVTKSIDESETGATDETITTGKEPVDDDGEYEIVPADECDDGEWMDDKLEQLKETTKPMGEDKLGASTESTVPGWSKETDLSMDDLMLSDAPASPVGSEGTGITGSGDQELTSVPSSGTSVMESTVEGSGDFTISAFETDTPIEVDTAYSLGSAQTSEGDTTVSGQESTSESTDSSKSSEISSEQATDISLSTESSKMTDSSALTSESSEAATDSSGLTTPSSDLTTGSSDVTTGSLDLTSGSSDVTSVSSDALSESSGETSPSSGLTTDSSDLATKSSDLTTDSSSIVSSSDSSTTSDLDETSKSEPTETTETPMSTDSSASTGTTDSTESVETTTSSGETSESTESVDVTTGGSSESSGVTDSTEASLSSQSSESSQSVTDSSTELSSSEGATSESSMVTDIGSTTDVGGSELTTSLSQSSQKAEEPNEPFIGESNIGYDVETTKRTTEAPSVLTTEMSGSSEVTTEEIETTGMSTEVEGSSEGTTETVGSTVSPASSSEGSTETVGVTESTTESPASTESPGSTEPTTEFTGSTQTDEFDIWSSTTESGAPEGSTDVWETTPIVEVFAAKKPRMCKRRKQKSCKDTTFGCCWDKITPAEGPFDKGCPNPKTCNESKFGCCEDGVSPALGPNFKGCPSTHCIETLFGCCPDNKTTAEGNNNEGCPPPPPACLKSKFGCCQDNVTEAQGPKYKGCEEEEVTTVTSPSSEAPDCSSTTYGCCPDGVEAAEDEFLKGCNISDCSETYFRCCPDGVTPAEGPNYQGCKMPCSDNEFGCCPDGVTPAHGRNGEGCCLASPHGCCPDNILPARGPNLEGCGCQYSPYRCCPDNVTAARGYNNEGCGCQYTEHGCCPDEYTPAAGPSYQGCLCHTFQFGCCPDGVSVAKGPHQQGCGCRNTEFGCCSDDSTPAQGPNFAGCGCDSSKYGCCPDGTAEASGDNFEGCKDIPPNLQESCLQPKERGACRNYTVKWFFDMDYGGCSRFWYGGCDGNNNRFKTKEECDGICVKPEGMDRCKLPKVSGPCEGYYPQWYYDTERKHCAQFIYGGCLGNNNRFETREDCMSLCVKDSSVDACEQDKEEGPCKGNYLRWYFDKSSKSCQQFIYGGCKSNNNNFPTEEACKQQCTQTGRKKEKDLCQLAAEIGTCGNYTNRWYYDTRERGCRQFYYGGCGGNGNNFETQQQCEQRCDRRLATRVTKPPETVEEPFTTEMCFLPSETGNCRAAELRYHYDRTDGVCKSFTYGGCGGNKNNFASVEQCWQNCGNAQDACALPPVVGPCNSEYEQFYYDARTDSCLPFKYGGCEGNYNRFPDKASCEQRCKRAVPTQEVPIQTQAPAVATHPTNVAMCYEQADPGNCTDNLSVFFFNPTSQVCTPFTYTGCGGNGNRFNSEEQCERQCGKFRGQDVCNMPREEGPCKGYFVKYYYEKSVGRCAQFAYGGCGGTGNRFSSNEECESICVTHEEKRSNVTSTAVGPQDHPCQAHFDECATLRCPYGIEAYVDDNQCNRCQCQNPCSKVDCPPNSQCAIDINRNRTTSEDPDFIAVCREINKEGECPTLEHREETNCEQECRNDADCSLQLKCCSTGCGTSCIEPIVQVPAELVTQQSLPVYTEAPIQSDYYAPKIDAATYEPEVQGLIGDQVTLRCAVTGNPVPKVTWRKDNLLIDGTQAKYRIKLDQSLQVITLHKTDSGVYLCTADNNVGQALTNQIKLDVVVPVTTNITSENQRFPTNAEVVIPCVVEGFPAPQVQWYKDGVPLNPSDRIYVAEDHRLSIQQATKADSGTYQCEAANAYSKSSSSITILVDGMYLHPNCKDNRYFANCNLIVKAKFCSHKYYAIFCCKSCTEAGLLPVDGPHLYTNKKHAAALVNNVV